MSGHFHYDVVHWNEDCASCRQQVPGAGVARPIPDPAPIGPGVIRSVLLNKYEREPFLALLAQKGVDPVAYQQRMMEASGVTAEDIARADAPVLAARAMIEMLPPAGKGEL